MAVEGGGGGRPCHLKKRKIELDDFQGRVAMHTIANVGSDVSPNPLIHRFHRVANKPH